MSFPSWAHDVSEFYNTAPKKQYHKQAQSQRSVYSYVTYDKSGKLCE